MRFTETVALAIVAVAALFAGACSSGRYHYIPERGQLSGGQVEGSDVVYPIPESGGLGSLRVRYLGTENDPQIPGSPQGKFIHLIILAQNDTKSGTWTLDSTDMYVAFPHDMLSPAVGALPARLELKPGARMGMDVYFPFPKQYATIDQVPGFVLHWKAEASLKEYAQSTTYRRVPGSQNQGSFEPGWNAPYNVPDAIYYGGSKYGWF